LIDDGSWISWQRTNQSALLDVTRAPHRAQQKRNKGTLLVLHCWYLSNRMQPNQQHPKINHFFRLKERTKLKE
jgi:hypothetical protein